jgi:hypothetical protein
MLLFCRGCSISSNLLLLQCSVIHESVASPIRAGSLDGQSSSASPIATDMLNQGISLILETNSNYQEAVALWRKVISSASEDGDTLRQARGIYDSLPRNPQLTIGESLL